MHRRIEAKHKWLIEHPDEEAKYAGEFIAVADDRIMAQRPVFADVLKHARALGYEPLMARAFGGHAEVYEGRIRDG